jgi:hypothetical protein
VQEREGPERDGVKKWQVLDAFEMDTIGIHEYGQVQG